MQMTPLKSCKTNLMEFEVTKTVYTADSNEPDTRNLWNKSHSELNYRNLIPSWVWLLCRSLVNITYNFCVFRKVYIILYVSFLLYE